MTGGGGAIVLARRARYDFQCRKTDTFPDRRARTRCG